MLFASIIVDISVKQLDRPFTYIIPDKLKDIEEGTCVRVPFGRGNRLIEGYVIDIMDETTYDTSKDNFKLKEIHSIVKDKVKVEERLIKTAAFIRKTTGSTMNAAMKVVMPVKMNVKFKEEKILSCDISSDTFKDAYATAVRRKYSAQLKVFNAINSESKILDFKKGVNYKSFREKYDLANSTLKALSDKGVIRLESYNVLRNPYENLEREDNNILLNDEQNEVKDSILEEYDRGDLRPALIHGVTGSGKTAVYIELIKEMINRGKTAILLIPEIALTLQNLKRFNNEFGDKCSVIHSKLSHGERFDRFEAVKRGEIKVMIGPRSALFTPFQNIGIIIIDEEHETGYRSETTPKYHAIEVAEYIAKTENAKLVLGSATPSVKSYRNAVDGKYTYHSLMKRAFSSAVLPRVQVVDMREELKNYNRSIFSNELKRLMNEKLAKGEQIMLFINRRGYSGFVSCRKCGEAIKCPHCSVSLKAHKERNGGYRLVCHYCGYERAFPKKCPQCDSKYIGVFGLGTQKVEEETKKMFPNARLLRMDADTTSKKFGHDAIISAFNDGKADILIGTQMIVKGHDFPNVTLVGILAADLSLNSGDYTSQERTYDLIVQAAGRAGRAEKKGDVIIQTYKPEEYAINTAAVGDYKKFYEFESNYRRLLHYPPFSHILEMFVFSKDEKYLRDACDKLAKDVNKRLSGKDTCLGPVEAPIFKVSDTFRMYIYVKSTDIVFLRRMSLDYEKIYSKVKGLDVQFKLS